MLEEGICDDFQGMTSLGPAPSLRDDCKDREWHQIDFSRRALWSRGYESVEGCEQIEVVGEDISNEGRGRKAGRDANHSRPEEAAAQTSRVRAAGINGFGA